MWNKQIPYYIFFLRYDNLAWILEICTYWYDMLGPKPEHAYGLSVPLSEAMLLFYMEKGGAWPIDFRFAL